MTNSLGLVRVVTAVIISVTEQVQANTVTIPALELLSLTVVAGLGWAVSLVRAVIAVHSGVTEPALMDTELSVIAQHLTSGAAHIAVLLIRAVKTVILPVTDPKVPDTHTITALSLLSRADLGGAGGLVTVVRAVSVSITAPG